MAAGAIGLEIFDVSNFASPSLTATFDTPGYAYDIRLSTDGKTAFVADGASGLQIIDVSNPATPSITATFDTPGRAEKVRLSADGKTAIVLDDGDKKSLNVIDVSNPVSPSLTATFVPTNDGNGISDFTLSHDGKTAFLAAGDLQIIDFSNPASPSLTATFETSAKRAVGVTLSVDDKNAYVADGDTSAYDYTSGGLHNIDVSNIASPKLANTLVTNLTAGPGDKTAGVPTHVTLSPDGLNLYVVNETWPGLLAMSTGQMDYVGPEPNVASAAYYQYGAASGVSISGDGSAAFLGINDHFQIINVKKPYPNGIHTLTDSTSFSSTTDTAKIEVLERPENKPPTAQSAEPQQLAIKFSSLTTKHSLQLLHPHQPLR